MGPKDQVLGRGWKIKGRGRAGERLWVVAARRTRWLAAETDRTERLQERKEGWRRRRRWWRGRWGGRGSHMVEIGSKV